MTSLYASDCDQSLLKWISRLRQYHQRRIQNKWVQLWFFSVRSCTVNSCHQCSKHVGLHVCFAFFGFLFSEIVCVCVAPNVYRCCVPIIRNEFYNILGSMYSYIYTWIVWRLTYIGVRFQLYAMNSIMFWVPCIRTYTRKFCMVQGYVWFRLIMYHFTL